MAKQAGAELIRWKKQRVAELKEQVLNVDVETQLEQVRILAQVLSWISESPNQINAGQIGWVGTLLNDTVERLDLALELESQASLPTALENMLRESKEVVHG